MDQKLGGKKQKKHNSNLHRVICIPKRKKNIEQRGISVMWTEQKVQAASLQVDCDEDDTNNIILFC